MNLPRSVPFLIFVVCGIQEVEKRFETLLLESFVPNAESAFQERCGSCIRQPRRLDNLIVRHVLFIESVLYCSHLIDRNLCRSRPHLILGLLALNA